MKNSKHNIRCFILAIITLSVFNCGDPILTVSNKYTETIVIEIWSGEDIFYDLGKVVGYQLKEELPLERILMNKDASLTIDSEEDNQLFIIVGTIQGSSYAYLSSTSVSMSSSDATYKVDSTGAITEGYY